MKIRIILLVTVVCMWNCKVNSQGKTVEFKINDTLSFNYTAEELYEEFLNRNLISYINLEGKNIIMGKENFPRTYDQSLAINNDSINNYFFSNSNLKGRGFIENMKNFNQTYIQNPKIKLDSLLKKYYLYNANTDMLFAAYETIHDDPSLVEANTNSENCKVWLDDANRVVSFVDSSDIYDNKNGTFTLLFRSTYGNSFSLCPGELFYYQPKISTCTGVVIDYNKILTASHCIEEKSFTDFRYIFNYRMLENGEPNLTLKKDDILIPEKIIKIDKELDYAIIRVKGTISKERIAPRREKEKISDNESLCLIGFPNGLPIKIDTLGKIILNTDALYFYAAIDAYEGNSGSPVFNKRTHLVEGILVGGSKDFEKNNTVFKNKDCQISFKCPCSRNPEECKGEKVLRITQIKVK